MKMDFDILVVGGGLNGLVLVLVLVDVGLCVVVVDIWFVDVWVGDGFDGWVYVLVLVL